MTTRDADIVRQSYFDGNSDQFAFAENLGRSVAEPDPPQPDNAFGSLGLGSGGGYPPIYTMIFGSFGNDYMLGSASNDAMYGMNGNDKLFGQNGNDLLYGGADEDVIYGGTGNDKLYGDDGNDVLEGGPGDDVLYGGVGNDKLNGGLGDDLLYGGAHYDEFHFDVSPAGWGHDSVYARQTNAERLFFDLDGITKQAFIDGLTIGQIQQGVLIEFGQSSVLLVHESYDPYLWNMIEIV